ncbi:DUF6624 domain-containing protein [Polaribacter tangerinus]|uniref:DUF6624 domain-containing protein n=1 Tax=Polaribacter tangerinus TaxID=1920034 RepID=UPI000B4B8F0F|nr:DUF6624 domain-containing protein [Polaribacter tangerinus]
MADFDKIASLIIKLKNTDIRVRDELIRKGILNDEYHPEMEKIHIENAKILETIIDKHGYPTIQKVGKEAHEAAWLIIQHAISKPQFMKKCQKLLEIVVKENNASKINNAYLKDRIAVFENKKQFFGTQFDWDKNGKLAPNPLECIIKVNKRRKSIGLNSIEEQTEILNNIAKKENQHPPKDALKLKQSYEAWRKKVGWIN